MRKRSILASLAVTISMLVSLVPVASAQSASNAIRCGLWSGSNFDTSGKCPTNTGSGSNGSSGASQTPPMRPVPKQTNNYVALGDSVAAGLGLPAGTTASDQQCGRSAQGYPSAVAASVSMPLVNVSCSGATVGDLFTKQAVSGPNITAQLDRAFAQGRPKLITITAGANDVHWADFLKACYASSCGGRSYNYTAQAYIAAMKVKLRYALADINARSGGKPPKVIITGYYYPLSSKCTSDKLTAAELAWLNSMHRGLNSAIQSTSGRYSFVKYTPINFAGHDICSANPWVQGLNDAAPFHPTAAGQQAIAAAVIKASR